MDKTEKETMAIGLYFKCPVTNNNPIDCQLHDIRKMKFKDFLNYMKNLDEAQLDVLISNHKNCPHNKI